MDLKSIQEIEFTGLGNWFTMQRRCQKQLPSFDLGMRGRLYDLKVTIRLKGLENYFGSFFIGAEGEKIIIVIMWSCRN